MTTARTRRPRAAAPTLAQIAKWPATVDLPTAGTAYGISRAHAYELVKRGEFPARVIKAGGRYVVVTASILRSLGADGAA